MPEKLKQHEIIGKFIFGLQKDLANSLLIIGDTGVGKTETVCNKLVELGLKENQHYRFINSYSSPLEFYNILQEINELKPPKILVIDDGEEILTNRRILGLLRSALWARPDGRRIVYWNSTSSKVENQSFKFDGKIIFLLNALNMKNNLVKALVSRGFFLNIKFTNQEITNLIQERVKMPYKNLQYHQRKKIADFLEEESKNGKKLNLRHFPLAMNLFILSPNHYQNLVREMLIFV